MILKEKEEIELKKQMAVLARRIVPTIVNPKSMKSLTNCRLIPLDKSHSERLIGVDEVFRKIIGKEIIWILKDEIHGSAGPLQFIQCDSFLK